MVFSVCGVFLFLGIRTDGERVADGVFHGRGELMDVDDGCEVMFTDFGLCPHHVRRCVYFVSTHCFLGNEELR